MKDNADYTHYEKIRMVAARALQISQGAPVLTKISRGTINPLDIAMAEWEANVIPMDTVRRTN
jgi:DNA-directed RNA polymerase subunit K